MTEDVPGFPTGLLATRQAPAREFIEAKKKAKKNRPRPTRRAWSYSVSPDGVMSMSRADFLWAISTDAKNEKEKYEEDLREWYIEQGVCQEPYLPGENLEQYRARTGTNG